MPRKIDLFGMSFGKLTVVGKTTQHIGQKIAWECTCACGRNTLSTSANLRGGGSKSCGCVRSEKTVTRNKASRKFPNPAAANKNWHATHHAEKTARHRTLQMRKLFGITVSEYERLLVLQEFRCAVCRAELPKMNDINNKATLRRALDHNHKTGKVREFLCSRCNMGIGQMGDSPELLEAAAAYLRKHEAISA